MVVQSGNDSKDQTDDDDGGGGYCILLSHNKERSVCLPLS